MRRLISEIILIFVFVTLLFSCANIVAPTGGPQDVTPPKVTESKPENNSINFTGNEIRITFDEYMTLRDINKNLIVSPLLKKQPDIKIKGKGIQIKFEDTLKQNTTYVMSFGDAIADITEGNILKNFRYIFSTGDKVDSFVVSGKVINAYDLSPQKNFYVMLYRDLSDSAVLKSKPDYISRTNPSGDFSIGNVHEGRYHIFSLNDANNNFIFDQPSEDFAFYDSLIVPGATTMLKNDTLKKDSIVTRRITKYFPSNIVLSSYTEDKKRAYIAKSDRKDKKRCTFIMSKPLASIPKISLPGNEAKKGWYFMEKNKTYDTLTCWITDTTVSKNDTLSFLFSYSEININDSLKSYTDTVRRMFFSKQDKVKPGKKQDVNNIRCNITKGSLFDLTRQPVIESQFPVADVEREKIKLFEVLKDSSLKPVAFNLKTDSLTGRKITIDFKPLESTNYSFMVLPGAIKDIYNYDHDTLKTRFRTQTSEAYGNLILTINGVKSDIIIQLLNESNKPVLEDYVKANTRLSLKNINPGNYRLKVIFDDNHDRKWTPGNYLKKRQPEKVLFYKDKLNVRANWDLEQTWDIGSEK